ncbi:MAG: hypothetical protein R3F11_32720 [Verrucomicrobiales bacterium]
MVLAFWLKGAEGATNVWSEALTFREFSGQSGGFPSSKQRRVELPSGSARSFDVLGRTGIADTGNAVYGLSQDGQTDFSITPHVIDGSGGRWGTVNAFVERGGFGMEVTVSTGRSRPGDYSVVALEIQFSNALNLNAADFEMAFKARSGAGELYEWSMITVGGFDDAPFDVSKIADYNHLVYSDTSSGAFFDENGMPTGANGSNRTLAHGQSISQFLTGQPGSETTGGTVEPGWWADDGFNVSVGRWTGRAEFDPARTGRYESARTDRGG